MAKRKKKTQGAVAKGCVRCGWRYTDRWEPPGSNGLCQTCKHGHAKMDHERAQIPRDCCFLNARPVVTKKERERMKLGGPPDMPWYICDGEEGGCHRTFPFAPPDRVPWVWNIGTEPNDKEMEREQRQRSRY